MRNAVRGETPGGGAGRPGADVRPWGRRSISPSRLGWRTGVEALLLWLPRSEEHTSELQSRGHLVCRLLLEKKKNENNTEITTCPLSVLCPIATTHRYARQCDAKCC